MFFWLSPKSTSLKIIVKYVTYFSLTIHSVNMTNLITFGKPNKISL